MLKSGVEKSWRERGWGNGSVDGSSFSESGSFGRLFVRRSANTEDIDNRFPSLSILSDANERRSGTNSQV